MFGRNKITNQEASQYAMRSDFCRIFEKDMNRLYLLSFLLTGDRTMAEQCFVGGLHIAQEENQVFKEWAESWARRAIIQNAIRMIRPRKTSDAKQAMATPNADNAFTPHAEVALVVALPAFERFVFLMSVLERYSDQECSLSSQLHPCGCHSGTNSGAREVGEIRRSSAGAGKHHLKPKDSTN